MPTPSNNIFQQHYMAKRRIKWQSEVITNTRWWFKQSFEKSGI